MKLRSVLTVSAVGGLIVAGSIAPASAHDVETVFDVYARATSESEPMPGTAEPAASENTTVENQTDDADALESDTPAPPAVTTTQNAPDLEPSDEPEVIVTDDPVAEVDVSPLIAPVELSDVIRETEDFVGAAGLPAQVAAPESVMPLSQAVADEAVLPLIQESAAAAAGESPVLEPATGPDVAPIIGAGAEANILPAENETARPETEATRDIPPEPRKMDIVEIAPENSAPKTEDKRIETAGPPMNEPLPATGASSAPLALSGVLLLAAGLVLVSIRRRANNS